MARKKRQRGFRYATCLRAKPEALMMGLIREKRKNEDSQIFSFEQQSECQCNFQVIKLGKGQIKGEGDIK